MSGVVDPCVAVNGAGLVYREFSCDYPQLEPLYFEWVFVAGLSMYGEVVEALASSSCLCVASATSLLVVTLHLTHYFLFDNPIFLYGFIYPVSDSKRNTIPSRYWNGCETIRLFPLLPSQPMQCSFLVANTSWRTDPPGIWEAPWPFGICPWVSFHGLACSEPCPNCCTISIIRAFAIICVWIVSI